MHRIPLRARAWDLHSPCNDQSHSHEDRMRPCQPSAETNDSSLCRLSLYTSIKTITLQTKQNKALNTNYNAGPRTQRPSKILGVKQILRKRLHASPKLDPCVLMNGACFGAQQKQYRYHKRRGMVRMYEHTIHIAPSEILYKCPRSKRQLCPTKIGRYLRNKSSTCPNPYASLILSRS